MLQTANKEIETYRDNFAQFEARFGDSGPMWVRSMRREAMERFSQMGFPTLRDEDWKYTNLSPLTKVEFGPAPSDLDSLTSQSLQQIPFAGLGRVRLAFVNGQFAPGLSALDSLPDGLRVAPLSEVLEKESEKIENHLGRHAADPKEALSTLNTAFLREGAFIHVEADKVIEEPIQVLFLVTERASDSLACPRNLFLIEANSQASIIENYSALDDNRYFTNAVTEAVLADNAVLDHYKLELESHQAFHVGCTQARQGRDSNYRMHNMSLGGSLVRNNIATVLDGEGGYCALNGLFVANGKQHVDNFTTMEHAQPHCDSRELYKGILDGKSRGVFHGRIIVRPGAQKTDSKQTNDNLILSDNALINTKPQLEIYADDVKCTHGATIGQLEKDGLFYLRSRGIEEQAARSLMIYAFASEVLAKISHQPLRDELHAYLAGLLPNGDLVREAN